MLGSLPNRFFVAYFFVTKRYTSGMPRPARFGLSVLLAFATLPAFAQDTPDSAPDPLHRKASPAIPAPPSNGRITGTVLCADTRRPARGALILVLPVPSTDGKIGAGTPSQAFTRVASDGTYTAAHLAPGEYSVLALLPGYLSPINDMDAGDLNDSTPQKTRALMLRFGTVTVTGREAVRRDLSLERGAAVSGRVLYTDGSPASQVTIAVDDVNANAAAQKSPMDGFDPRVVMSTMFMHQSLGTDDQGRFRIAGLKPGTYRVAAVEAAENPLNGANAEGFGVMMGMGSPRDVHIYSGDTLHKKSAKTYELRTGDEVTGVDITIPDVAFHRVLGHLTSKDGRDMTTATLTLTDTADDTLIFNALVDTSGSFAFGSVPSGTYTLSATGALIGTLPDGFPSGMQVPREIIKATHAFADATTSVIVKDSDVADVTLPLVEVPLPPDANKPSPQFDPGTLGTVVSPQ